MKASLLYKNMGPSCRIGKRVSIVSKRETAETVLVFSSIERGRHRAVTLAKPTCDVRGADDVAPLSCLNDLYYWE